LGAELGLSHLAITYVPSFADADTEIDRNKLNGLSGSVFIVYKEHVITDKFIDLKPTQENMLRLTTALNP
jgi:protocatechuate 3,4-dioxygenase, beta subunit